MSDLEYVYINEHLFSCNTINGVSDNNSPIYYSPEAMQKGDSSDKPYIKDNQPWITLFSTYLVVTICIVNNGLFLLVMLI